MIPHWFARWATGRVVLAAVVVWLGLGFLIFQLCPYESVREASGGALLEETFGYSATQALEKIGAMDDTARRDYGTFQYFDALNTLLMVVAMSLALAFTLGRLTGPRNPLRIVVMLPALVGVFELIENTVLVSLASGATAGAALAGPVTSLKLVLGFISLPITLLCFLVLGVKSVISARRS